MNTTTKPPLKDTNEPDKQGALLGEIWPIFAAADDGLRRSPSSRALAG